MRPIAVKITNFLTRKEVSDIEIAEKCATGILDEYEDYALATYYERSTLHLTIDDDECWISLKAKTPQVVWEAELSNGDTIEGLPDVPAEKATPAVNESQLTISKDGVIEEKQEAEVTNDWPIVHTYSRKQALEDGTLVDLNQFLPVEESPYKCPIACTRTVWELIEKAVASPKNGNDYEGLIWDIMYMGAKGPGQMPNESTKVFKVVISGSGRRSVQLKIQIHAGDEGEMVGTLMFPDED